MQNMHVVKDATASKKEIIMVCVGLGKRRKKGEMGEKWPEHFKATATTMKKLKRNFQQEGRPPPAY